MKQIQFFSLQRKKKIKLEYNSPHVFSESIASYDEDNNNNNALFTGNT